MLFMARRINIFLAALALVPATLAAPQNRTAVSAPARILLQPRFTPGQVMRYRMALESTSTTRRSTLVRDPQGPTQLGVAWNATVRLEVFAAESTAGPTGSPAASPMRLRITYESSAATVRSDAPEPRSGEIQQQYAQLAGRSLEFTLTPGGRVSDIRGLDDFLSDERARAAVQQWVVQLSAAAATPLGGVVAGQKWNSTQPADLPLAGLSWRTDSTYLRNEPCRLANSSDAAAGAAAASDRQDCAVILSRLALVTTRALRDPTPDEYRRNGLRTSGRWFASGQNLMYVSLDTGWVVSSTQESSEEMDVVITSSAAATAGNAGSATPADSVRHSGAVTTRSQVSLLKDAPPELKDDAPSAASPAPPAR